MNINNPIPLPDPFCVQFNALRVHKKKVHNVLTPGVATANDLTTDISAAVAATPDLTIESMFPSIMSTANHHAAGGVGDGGDGDSDDNGDAFGDSVLAGVDNDGDGDGGGDDGDGFDDNLGIAHTTLLPLPLPLLPLTLSSFTEV